MQIKILIIVVAILTCLPITVAGASILDSVHNLLFEFEEYHYDGIEWDVYGEVCIYCHTPHNASVKVPLWNRQLSEPTQFSIYTSPTLEATPGFPSTSSLLCLSCHDGVTAIDAIVNVGKGPIAPGQFHYTLGECSECHDGYVVSSDSDFRGSVIGRNLSDDHPVSIEYVNSPRLQPKPFDGRFSNVVKLFKGKVECASCHNAHDPDIRPFLRTSNAGSALCLTCHNK